MYKKYRINDTFGIVCSGDEENGMNVEVIIMDLPWDGVVESYRNIKDKNKANIMFKIMVRKYKERSGNFI